MFKSGQKVVILKLYNLKSDGSATIVREVNEGRDKGKWVIETNSGCMVMEPDRIVDSKEYWKMVKDGRDHQLKK